MNITIEHIQLDELKALLRIQADDAFPDLKDEQRLNMLAEKWHKNAEFCTCRDESDRLVGMIAFYANQPENGVLYIPHVYVNNEYRGNGVFAELLSKVIDYAKPKGFKYIRLEVQSNNIRAQKAYQKNGFINDGSAGDESIFMKNNI